VLIAEDARFCQHFGVDWQGVQAAIEDAEDGEIRGASGISQQGTPPPPDLEVVAPTRSAGGNRLVWLAVVVVLGLIFAYAAGMLR